MFNGFEPIFNKDSKVLILGSFPSVKSRENNFYYGNPNNKFWKMLQWVTNKKIPTSVDEKIAFLLKYKIALWDIVSSCEITGSSDSEIKVNSIADINKIISVADIKKILCNGKTAYSLTIKNFPNLEPICISLPSTSPANTTFSYDKWTKAFLEL